MENTTPKPINTQTGEAAPTAQPAEKPTASAGASGKGATANAKESADIGHNMTSDAKSETCDAAEETPAGEPSQTDDSAAAASGSAMGGMRATVSFPELLEAVSEAHKRGFSEGMAQARATAEAAEPAEATTSTTPASFGTRTYAPLSEGTAVPDATPAFLSNLRPGFWD